MGPFHLAVQPWRTRFDVGVPYAQVLQMPVEFDLKFMTVIGPNCIDAKRELGNDVIHEVDRILLGMLFINLQGANTGGIINCRVLEVPDLMSILGLQIEEFHVDLHVVAWHLLLIADRGNRSFALPVRQTIKAMTL